MNSVTAIDKLNEIFGIPGIAQVTAGGGGLAQVKITSSVATADIYLHGAQVTGWCPTGGNEVIFLSKQSRWEDGRAIRGGVPICFPWFRAKADDAKAPAHGVVRTKAWTLTSLSHSADDVIVTMATESDESSRRWWPYEFRLVHRITVGSSLKLELIATNNGDTPFTIEEALHTYHLVGDVEKVRVGGLDGTNFLDNMDGNKEKTQAGDIVLTGATDNAYMRTTNALQLIDPVMRRRVRIEKGNSLTTIVWNPWEKGAKALADLGNDEWKSMVCVEASNILSAAVDLAPGAEHTMTATITVQPDVA
jgi:glucose-6-phosphate 1-epimerase